MRNMQQSKAYVATLPASISQEQLERLDAWGVRNCWRSAVVRQKNAHTVWIAVREKMRTKEDCARHVVDVLAALGVRRRPEEQDWLRLLGVDRASGLIEQSRWSTSAAEAASKRATHDDDTKIVDLSTGVSRRTGRRSAARRYANISVTKE